VLIPARFFNQSCAGGRSDAPAGFFFSFAQLPSSSIRLDGRHHHSLTGALLVILLGQF